MPKREKVPADQKPNPGQIGNVIARFTARLNGLTGVECDQIANSRKIGAQFDRGIVALLVELGMGSVVSSAYSADITRWEMNCEKLFGHKPDLSKIQIPAKPEGQGPMRLIVVAKEIVEWTGNKPLQGTMDALKKHFPCWHTDDLDKSVVKNDRDPKNGSYAVWVKDVREADEENAGKSANDLASENYKDTIVLERMLLEADYFFEHDEHLDQQNWTLCAGSRDAVGYVSGARWRDSEFRIAWSDPTSRGSYLRSRKVFV